MAKITRKSRVAKLHKMGLRPAQIAIVTGISRQEVNVYIWQLRNPKKHKDNYKRYNENNRDKRKEQMRRNYQANRELRLETMREYYHNVVKFKAAGVVPP